MKGLSASNHFKLAESLEVEFFMAGEYIVREGTRGDTFFIITKGSVGLFFLSFFHALMYSNRHIHTK